MQKNTNKQNSAKVIAVILMILIVAGVGGLIWLYITKSTLESKVISQINQKTKTTTVPTATPTVLPTAAPCATTTAKNKIKSNSASDLGSSSDTDPGESEKANAGGIGESGVLDTDVPWREEGEPDLDYSYKEVRACGALIKGPPEISSDQAEFEKNYNDYLAWVEEDCRAAYREAGRDYPF